MSMAIERPRSNRWLLWLVIAAVVVGVLALLVEDWGQLWKISSAPDNVPIVMMIPPVVILRLLEAQPREEDDQRNHHHDGDVVRRRADLPELPPVLYEEGQDAHGHNRDDKPQQPAIAARLLYCHCHIVFLRKSSKFQVASSKLEQVRCL